MKKIAILFVLLVSLSVVVAQQGPRGIHEPGTGLDDPEMKEAGQSLPEPTLISAEPGAPVEAVPVSAPVGPRRLMAGEYTAEGGKMLRVQQSGERMQLRAGGSSAQTDLQLTQEMVQGRTMFRTQLSNGKGAEIKVLPDVAAERARERLQLKVCSDETGCVLELKEVGQGEQVRAAYEVKAQKESRLLGVFRKQMQVQAQVDAESGEIIQSKKPWWAFLASE